jgi:hypothetical protein
MVQVSYEFLKTNNKLKRSNITKLFHDKRINKNLVLNQSLSNAQAVVVRDIKNNETYIVYHGSANRPVDNQAVKDVMLLKGDANAEIKASEAVFLNAFKNERVAGSKIHLVGYSLSAQKVNYLSRKFPNIIDEVTYINPFLSPFDHKPIPEHIKNNIFRVIDDPVTFQSLAKKFNNNTEVTHVLPLVNNEGIIQPHTLNQFIETEDIPRMSKEDVVNAFREDENANVGIVKANRYNKLFSAVDGILTAVQFGFAISDTVNAIKTNEDPEEFSNQISRDLQPLPMNFDPDYHWDETTVPSPLKEIIDPIRSDHSKKEILADKIENKSKGKYKENKDGSIEDSGGTVYVDAYGL